MASRFRTASWNLEEEPPLSLKALPTSFADVYDCDKVACPRAHQSPPSSPPAALCGGRLDDGFDLKAGLWRPHNLAGRCGGQQPGQT
jgi:hypothetical protein